MTLLQQLEAAGEGSRSLDRQIWYDFEFDSRGEPSRCPYYTTSLDASLALAERVLPGFALCLLTGGEGWDSATIALDGEPVSGHASTPALALCAAILRAKQ